MCGRRPPPPCGRRPRPGIRVLARIRCQYRTKTNEAEAASLQTGAERSETHRSEGGGSREMEISFLLAALGFLLAARLAAHLRPACGPLAAHGFLRGCADHLIWDFWSALDAAPGGPSGGPGGLGASRCLNRPQGAERSEATSSAPAVSPS